MKPKISVAANSDEYVYPTLAILTFHDPEPELSEMQLDLCGFLIRRGLLEKSEAEKLVRDLGEKRSRFLRHSLKNCPDDGQRDVVTIFQERKS